MKNNVPQDIKMPFIDHLNELRQRLIKIIIVLAAISLLVFPISKKIIDFIILPLNSDIIFLSPTEALWNNIKIAMITGLFISLPFIFYHIWAFISPALFKKERRLIFFFTLSSIILFLLGVTFFWFALLPIVLNFLLSYQTVSLRPMISLGLYIDFIVRFILIFGFIFELPLFITIISSAGIVNPHILSRFRKYFILIAFVFSAILTPTVDIINQSLVAIPLILLYEVGIICSRIVYYIKNKR
ncbi:MAG: twin-arginine translocase subunit TatC [Nitrospirota bacterium]